MGDLLMERLSNEVNAEANILSIMETILALHYHQTKDANPEYSEYCKQTREWIKLLKKVHCAKQ
jgi:hypothetical protein